MVSVKDEFPDQWEKWQHSEEDLKLDLGKASFPPMFRGKKIALNSASLFLETKQGADVPNLEFNFQFWKESDSSSQKVTFKTLNSPISGLPYAHIENLDGESGEMSFTKDKENSAHVENMLLVIGYTVQ